jgi:hypothetical protein
MLTPGIMGVYGLGWHRYSLNNGFDFFQKTPCQATHVAISRDKRWPYAKVSESLSAKGGTLRSLAGRFRRNGPEDFRPSHE